MTTAPTDGVLVERRGSTVVLTMSNPGRRNAFFNEMRNRLADCLLEFGMQKEVRAFVLTGADGHFCAGADLARAAPDVEARPSTLALRERMKEVHRLLRAMTSGVRPVIAAVEGDAFGAGLSMASACDWVVATRTSRFGSAFARLGILPDVGLLYTLPQRVGMPKARDMMIRARPIGGEEALRIGLADELAEPGTALAAALKYAEEVAELAPLTIAHVKTSLDSVRSLEDAMRLELDLQPALALSADCKEGMRAFMEKRAPRFEGR
jgi:enoyl-CoA hydratase/carnithine racemase